VEVDRAQRRGTTDAWMELPLTIAQVKSLSFVVNHGGATAGKLAEAMRVTPANMTGIVDRLVKHGLVSRSENPDDRRVMLLHATARGEELVSSLRERKKSYMLEVLGRMTVEELGALAGALESLARATAEREAETTGGNPRELD